MKAKHFLALLFAVTSAHAGEPPKIDPRSWTAFPRTSLGLDVRGVAARKNVKDDYKTDYGSYDKTYNRERVIEATVRTTGTAADPILAVWWIGKSTYYNRRTVLRHQRTPINVQPGKPAIVELASGDIEARDMKLNAIGYRKVGGDRIEGWLVAILDPATGQPIAWRASEPGIASLARSGELDRLPSN